MSCALDTHRTIVIQYTVIMLVVVVVVVAAAACMHGISPYGLG